MQTAANINREIQRGFNRPQNAHMAINGTQALVPAAPLLNVPLLHPGRPQDLQRAPDVPINRVATPQNVFAVPNALVLRPPAPFWNPYPQNAPRAVNPGTWIPPLQNFPVIPNAHVPLQNMQRTINLPLHRTMTPQNAPMAANSQYSTLFQTAQPQNAPMTVNLPLTQTAPSQVFSVANGSILRLGPSTNTSASFGSSAGRVAPQMTPEALNAQSATKALPNFLLPGPSTAVGFGRTMMSPSAMQNAQLASHLTIRSAPSQGVRIPENARGTSLLLPQHVSTPSSAPPIVRSVIQNTQAPGDAPVIPPVTQNVHAPSPPLVHPAPQNMQPSGTIPVARAGPSQRTAMCHPALPQNVQATGNASVMRSTPIQSFWAPGNERYLVLPQNMNRAASASLMRSPVVQNTQAAANGGMRANTPSQTANNTFLALSMPVAPPPFNSGQLTQVPPFARMAHHGVRRPAEQMEDHEDINQQQTSKKGRFE